MISDSLVAPHREPRGGHWPTPGSAWGLVHDFTLRFGNNSHVEWAPRHKLGAAAPSDQQSADNFPCLTTCCSAGFASLVLPAWLERLVTVMHVKCPAGALPDEERLQCPDLSRWGLFLCSQGHILTDLGSHCYFAYILPCSKLAPRHSRQAARLESAHWGKRLTWGHLAVLFGAEWRRPGHRRVVDGDPRAHDSGHSGGLSIKSIGPCCDEK